MRRSLSLLSMLLLAGPLPASGKPAHACMTADEAARHVNHTVCLAAHIYEIVQLPDGTRFLDVCPPEMPDEECRFALVSRKQDWETVGELSGYRGRDVEVRGLVQAMNGRAGMLLSHLRQFYGGPPRFRPNPALMRGFTAEQEDPPVRDPNLRSQGGHRLFMNTQDREKSPTK